MNRKKDCNLKMIKQENSDKSNKIFYKIIRFIFNKKAEFMKLDEINNCDSQKNNLKKINFDNEQNDDLLLFKKENFTLENFSSVCLSNISKEKNSFFVKKNLIIIKH